MTEPVRQPLANGDRVDGYVVRTAIGHGASAWVYEAEQERDGTIVAIKVLRPEAEGDEVVRRRFERELDTLAAVRSPHVPRVHGVGTLPDGLPYVIMDRLRGRTLFERLRDEEPLPITTVVELGIQLASALAATHAVGMVHRDVKPGNLFLHVPDASPDADEDEDEEAEGESGAEPVLVLLDFGVCRPVGDDDPKVTLPGRTVGTPDYMSPEQARGLPLDPRSDVFGAGSVLYEMIGGRPPFGGRSPEAIARAVVAHEPRPLAARRPDCPPELVAIVERAMAKEREARFGSAEALRAALEAFARAAGRRPEPPASGARPTIAPAEDRPTEVVDVPTHAGWRRALTVVVVLAGVGAGALHVVGGPGAGAREGDADPGPALPTTVDYGFGSRLLADRLELLSRLRVSPMTVFSDAADEAADEAADGAADEAADGAAPPDDADRHARARRRRRAARRRTEAREVAPSDGGSAAAPASARGGPADGAARPRGLIPEAAVARTVAGWLSLPRDPYGPAPAGGADGSSSGGRGGPSGAGPNDGATSEGGGSGSGAPAAGPGAARFAGEPPGDGATLGEPMDAGEGGGRGAGAPAGSPRDRRDGFERTHRPSPGQEAAAQPELPDAGARSTRPSSGRADVTPGSEPRDGGRRTADAPAGARTPGSGRGGSRPAGREDASTARGSEPTEGERRVGGEAARERGRTGDRSDGPRRSPSADPRPGDDGILPPSNPF